MTEQQQTRIVAHRLAVLRHAEEVSGNISRTCRYYALFLLTCYLTGGPPGGPTLFNKRPR